MKNFIKCAKKAIICVAMALIIFFSSFTSAHAFVDPVTGVMIVTSVLSGISSLITIADSGTDWGEVYDQLEAVWRSSPSSRDVVYVTADQMYDLYLEANQLGYPCELRERYISGIGSYWCIVGTGYIETMPDGYFVFHSYESTNLSNRVLTTVDGFAIVTNENLPSNQLLLNIYTVFGAYIDGLESYLSNILSSVRDISSSLPTYVEQITTNAVANTTTMVEQITTNADANAAAIVDALDSTFDFTPVTERLDTLIAEVQKVSSHTDVYDVTTVVPGVLGDVSVVTYDDWHYDDLSFVYAPLSGEFYSFETLYYYTWQDILDDPYETGSGCVEFFLEGISIAPYYALEVNFNTELFDFSDCPAPIIVKLYGYDGSLVGIANSYECRNSYVFYGPDVSYVEVSISNSYDWYTNYFYSDAALVSLSIGLVDSGPVEKLTFVVDNFTHHLYWENEIEFPYGCVTGDVIYYDDGHWYRSVEGGLSVYSLNYYDAYLTDALTPPPTIVTTTESDTYSWFEWFYNDYAKRGGLFDVTPIVDKLTSIENALSNMGSNIDIENNTNININEENENYNIFYVDDPDGGEDKSIVDLSGDTLKVFGKLLDFLYKVGFKGALDDAGGGIGDLSDFYLDTSEGSADLWVS